MTMAQEEEQQHYAIKRWSELQLQPHYKRAFLSHIFIKHKRAYNRRELSGLP